MPESDKLIALSDFFEVSLDYLLKDEPLGSPAVEVQKPVKRCSWLAGAIVCILGVLGLLVWGLLSLCFPQVMRPIIESSAVVLDGSGIFLVLCVIVLVIGVVLLLKGLRKP